ncbi:DUF1641 domain-containing protein [Candidatus Halobonum tyrrellensis]|uniref:DUF1641 domain-containing protein n=1 Tax=Candidatus Halobonum tyrrellensis G22 TaxID=1324957 RepID=V4HF98_9EURY|nr:DUF1641 domain-containing protein [Candidatus Halobonum tyrrellensis]ESP88778.1 hypothetical protein K933_07276 [Candidatus Halobonum tyrrellensis G22]
MAKPQESYPEAATNGARKRTPDPDNEVELREALDRHGDRLAAAVENTDELEDVLTTAILVVASADEEDIDHVTESTGALLDAVDGISTAEVGDLAASVGDNADDLTETLDVVLDLQREGQLDDLVRLAAAFSESLSPAEVEELATMLEANGSELVDALDAVLDLQREGRLDDLVEIAKAVSVVDIDEDTAEGMDTFLSAIGDAHREARSGPTSLLGIVGQLTSRDARAGLAYLISLLKAQGRRVRER